MAAITRARMAIERVFMLHQCPGAPTCKPARRIVGHSRVGDPSHGGAVAAPSVNQTHGFGPLA